MSVTMSPEQAAERYGINKGTLANLRSKKQGPPYLKMPGQGKKKNTKILYRVKDFEAWVFANPVKTMESPEVSK